MNEVLIRMRFRQRKISLTHVHPLTKKNTFHDQTQTTLKSPQFQTKSLAKSSKIPTQSVQNHQK